MSLLALANALTEWGFDMIGFQGITIQTLLSYVFAPFAWVMGAPWDECLTVGQLLGEKTFMNELVAYSNLSQLLRENPNALSERSLVIVSYALCGFANFMSVGMLIGGIGALIPERRSEIAMLGIRAMIAGTLAAFSTACIASILLV